MKKTLILGAAAVAAMGIISTADAGDVKMSGYYQFRLQNADNNVTDEIANDDDINRWVQRLQINMDFTASQKTHAHMRMRVVDTDIVDGADNADIRTSNANDGANWQVRQLWLETEMYGVGVKVGNMPLDFNDKILVNHDTTSFGSIVVSKSFGDLTVAAMDVRTAEGDDGNGTETNANEDDADLYGITILGKMGGINYQATGAYFYQGETNTATTATESVDDGWLALTLGGAFGGVDLTGTLIYETGADVDGGNGNSQSEEDGLLAALRAKGKLSFGGWNGYLMYAGQDYDNIVNGRAEWSPTWDMGGAGAQDLMKIAIGAAGAGALNSGTGGQDVENVWGIGAGLSIEASGWTIKPYLDYAAIVDEDPSDTGATASNIDDAWGGSLILSTKIDTDTTLDLTGNYVDPDSNNNGNDDSLHQLMATITMKF